MDNTFEYLISQKALVDRYLNGYPAKTSVEHFSSLWLWAWNLNFSVDEIDGCLMVKASLKSDQQQSPFLYWPPIGHLSRPLILGKMDQIRQVNHRTARIENIPQGQESFYRELGFRVYHKASEYVYDKEEIACYKGNRYKSQRHQVNQAVKSFEFHVATFESSHIPGCLSLLTQWNGYQKKKFNDDPIAKDMLESSLIVIDLALKDAAFLGLKGIVIFEKNTIAAFSLGYSLNPDTFVVLLEICNPTMTGLPAFTFSQMCQHPMWKEMARVNAMDDFGLDQLKRTKEQYHPIEIISIYNAA